MFKCDGSGLYHSPSFTLVSLIIGIYLLGERINLNYGIKKAYGILTIFMAPFEIACVSSAGGGARKRQRAHFA